MHRLQKSAIGLPASVCWNISGYCNESCEYCFGPISGHELPFALNMQITMVLAANGIRKISWAGGEPTLYVGLERLAQEARQLGLMTSITTNASPHASRWIRQNHRHFDWITVPLDSLSIESQTALGRSKEHLQRVRDLLDFVSKESQTLLKVNTVVTSLNHESLSEIPQFISALGVTRWKLFRFLPSRGRARTNRKRLEITDDAFARACDVAIKAANTFPTLRTSIVDTSDYSDSHFSVEPSGDVFTYTQGEYRHCGSLLVDNPRVIADRAATNAPAIAARFALCCRKDSQCAPLMPQAHLSCLTPG